MSWINFSHLIAGNDANIEHWHNAIKANPNTPADALKVAILERVIDMKDMELLENLCSCVVSIVNQAVEQSVQSDSAETSGNLLALLEECYENGNAGETQLYAWFSDQANIIEQAIEDARQETPSR